MGSRRSAASLTVALLPPIALTDEVTALAGAFAVMVALRHAERTGEGQVVDVNLLESMFQLMGPPWPTPTAGTCSRGSVPASPRCRDVPCADGVWVAISSSAETVAQRLLELLGIEETSASQRSRTAPAIEPRWRRR